MRERLISVAIEKFGQNGFDGASTREIAAAAETGMSSIRYHFGSKEGLYEAATEAIFSRVNEAIGPFDTRFARGTSSREQQIDGVVEFLLGVAKMMLRDESEHFALFVARMQQSATAENLAMLRRNMQPAMEGFLDQIRKLKPGLAETEVRATSFFLFSLTVSLRSSNSSLRILLDHDRLSSADTAILLQRIEAIVRAVLREEDA